MSILKHIQAHQQALAAQLAAYQQAQGTLQSVNVGPVMNQDVIDRAKKEMREAFLSCSPTEREAYLNHLRAKVVEEKLNPPNIFTQQYNSYQTFTGYPGTGFRVNLSLRELEDLHANDIIDRVVLSDNNTTEG